MNTIWQLGKPCVISEILKCNTNLKRNTVAKILLILEKKGYIAVDSIVKTATRTGRAYKALINQADYQQQNHLINTLYDTNTATEGILKYCMSLIDSRNISQDFINEIEQMIADYKNKED